MPAIVESDCWLSLFPFHPKARFLAVLILQVRVPAGCSKRKTVDDEDP